MFLVAPIYIVEDYWSISQCGFKIDQDGRLFDIKQIYNPIEDKKETRQRVDARITNILVGGSVLDLSLKAILATVTDYH